MMLSALAPAPILSLAWTASAFRWPPIWGSQGKAIIIRESVHYVALLWSANDQTWQPAAWGLIRACKGSSLTSVSATLFFHSVVLADKP